MKVLKRIMAVLLLVLLCVPVGLSVDMLSAEAAAVSESTPVGDAAASGQAESSASGQSQKKSANGAISTDDFEIQVVCGLNGNFRSGASIPVTIYIESLKKDFEGTVRMIVPGDSDYGTDAVAYEKEVLLSAGVQKVVTMSVYSSSSMSAFKFQLEDESGDILVDKNVTMKSQSGEQVLVGVLSDDYTALNYFDGLPFSLDSGAATNVRLVELDVDIFPEQASGIEALGYLIINSYDTSVLSDAQYNAIKGWVEQGGVLIIGTGSDYSRTLSVFQDDFLEGSVGDAIEGTMELDGENSEALNYTKEQGIMEISLKNGKTLKGVFRKTDAKSGLVWSRDYKQGHVVVTAFNLGMEPIVSWSQKSKMASLLLEKSAFGYSSTRIDNLSYGNVSIDRWMLSSALDGLHDVNYPNMKLLGILFVVFILVVGPGLYLLLKAFDKREWMWLLVPVLAIGFTAGIFLVTQNLRIRYPRESSVTTLYYDMDSENDVQEKVYMAIQVPGAGKEQVHLNPSMVNLKLGGEGYDYYYYGLPGDQTLNARYEYKTAVRETAEGYQLGIRNKETFGSAYMSMNHVTEDSSACGLELEAERTIAGIKGKVTNQTGQDLYCVSVYSGSSMIMLGSLKAGESKEFTEKDNRYQEYYDYYDMTFSGLPADVKEQDQIQSIWYLFASEYLNNMDSRDIYTYAYVGSIDADYVADEQVEERNKAVIVRRDSIGFSDYEDARILNLYDYAKNSGSGWDMDGQLYVADIDVEFDLGNIVSSIYALKRAKDSEAMYGPTDSVTVYGYNVDNGTFEELFKDGEFMEFRDGCPYIDDKGVIRLKFTCTNAGDYIYTPQITVVGGES
ncbi:MAG: hypothetical protein ACI4D3_00940 [Lachnospiraceae bacterium]